MQLICASHHLLRVFMSTSGERTYGAMQCASLEAAGASGDTVLDAAGHAGM
jgi:hypothetical protein